MTTLCRQLPSPFVVIQDLTPDKGKNAMADAKLTSLQGRRFYGVVIGDEYRACVAIRAEDDAGALSLARWTIPGGRYVRRKIPNWEANLPLIYRSRQELLLMAPVR